MKNTGFIHDFSIPLKISPEKRIIWYNVHECIKQCEKSRI